MFGEYEVQILPMEEGDIPELVSITERFYNESPHTHYRKFDRVVMAAHYLKDLENDNRCCFVARDGNQIYGAIRGFTAWSEWADEKLVYENGWYILPEARNSKIGATLKLALENWAKKQGTEIVFITLMGEPMPQAKIEKMGLTPIALMTRAV